MRIFIAEDEPYQRAALESLLTEWGYDVVTAQNGDDAWRILQGADCPALAIIDSIMPGLTGPELCLRLRREAPGRPRHIILLTSMNATKDIEEGLEAGADAYVGKPFNETELRARIRAGFRAVSLQTELAKRVRELERAMERIKKLEGILPICSYCKKIKDDYNDWQRLEAYISHRSEAKFSHGICPECYENIVETQLRGLENQHKGFET